MCFFFSSKELNLTSPWKHILWYSLEVPQWGTSNEYQNALWEKKISYYPSYMEPWSICNCTDLDWQLSKDFLRLIRLNTHNMFSWRNKSKNYVDNHSYLELCELPLLLLIALTEKKFNIPVSCSCDYGSAVMNVRMFQDVKHYPLSISDKDL